MTQPQMDHSLQSLLWPEKSLSTEQDVYLRVNDFAFPDYERETITFATGGRAQFNTYANAFDIGTWSTRCDLETVGLMLEAHGTFELCIYLAAPDTSWERIYQNIVDIKKEHPFCVDVPSETPWPKVGTLHFELRCMSQNGTLAKACWVTSRPPVRTPDLMLSITTFRREAEVTRSIERFKTFHATTPIADHLHLTVVDNGQTLTQTEHDPVTLVPNPNLGGSGGFARGLLEAKRRNAEYCLFMDDDAAIQMQAIERTWIFLSYATDPKTAVAGAVANAQHRWMLWENGAVFDSVCQPIGLGTDLRDFLALQHVSLETAKADPRKFYGGWWYFAFPVAAVTHMPFPFFVRGDDVSFSLVHDFETVTLPGVISYQAENFDLKETPTTVYLDLRSHMSHHYALPHMEIGRAGITKIALRFFLRSLLNHHYDTLSAVNLALGDVAQGPTFFNENADMSNRRAQLKRITQTEGWYDTHSTQRSRPRKWISPNTFVLRALMKITLNGHFLPGFKLFGNRLTLPASQRNNRRLIWGAAEITYETSDGEKAYSVKHSKTRALRETLTFLRHTLELWRSHATIQQAWRDGYIEQTTDTAWTQLIAHHTPAQDAPQQHPTTS